MILTSYRLPASSTIAKTMTTTLVPTPADQARSMWLKYRTKARLRGEDIPEAAKLLIIKGQWKGISTEVDTYIAKREGTTTAAVSIYRKAL